MSDELSTVFLFCRSVFTLFTPSIIGEFIENNSHIFIGVEIFYIISYFILFCVINYLIRKYENLINVNQTIY